MEDAELSFQEIIYNFFAVETYKFVSVEIQEMEILKYFGAFVIALNKDLVDWERIYYQQNIKCLNILFLKNNQKQSWLHLLQITIVFIP